MKNLINLGKVLSRAEQKEIHGSFGASNVPHIAQFGDGFSSSGTCTCSDGTESQVLTCHGTGCDNACATNGGKDNCV